MRVVDERGRPVGLVPDPGADGLLVTYHLDAAPAPGVLSDPPRPRPVETVSLERWTTLHGEVVLMARGRDLARLRRVPGFAGAA